MNEISINKICFLTCIYLLLKNPKPLLLHHYCTYCILLGKCFDSREGAANSPRDLVSIVYLLLGH